MVVGPSLAWALFENWYVIAMCFFFWFLKFPNNCLVRLRSGNCGRQFELHGFLWFFKLFLQAARCVWDHYSVTVWILLHKDVQTGRRRVEHVSVKASNKSVRKIPSGINLPNTMFYSGFDTLRYHSLSSLSPYMNLSVTAINLRL